MIVDKLTKSGLVKLAMENALAKKEARIDLSEVPNSTVRQLLVRFKYLYPQTYFMTKKVNGYTYVYTDENNPPARLNLDNNLFKPKGGVLLTRAEVEEIANGMRDLIRGVLMRRLDAGNYDDEKLV
jgi:glycerol-3-phosphate dehydrogenase